ncbi:MAG: hypothetical protein KAS23_00245 [Anaerohalosphaera sp.]|nr:hypothetical protein [Anaerohalosphaera sp.]
MFFKRKKNNLATERLVVISESLEATDIADIQDLIKVGADLQTNENSGNVQFRLGG